MCHGVFGQHRFPWRGRVSGISRLLRSEARRVGNQAAETRSHEIGCYLVEGYLPQRDDPSPTRRIVALDWAHCRPCRCGGVLGPYQRIARMLSLTSAPHLLILDQAKVLPTIRSRMRLPVREPSVRPKQCRHLPFEPNRQVRAENLLYIEISRQNAIQIEAFNSRQRHIKAGHDGYGYGYG